jgi:hypothetical protein
LFQSGSLRIASMAMRREDPVAAGNRDRLARDRHQRVHQVRIHLAPHPRVHAAHGAAEHEPQVPHVETLGEHAVLGLDDVAVAVVREFRPQAVARLARAAAADPVGQHDEILACVERLPEAKQLVGERRHQPVLAGAAGAVQQSNQRRGCPAQGRA